MKITRRHLQRLIKEEARLLEANSGITNGRWWSISSMTGEKHWGKEATPEEIAATPGATAKEGGESDGFDNDGDGEIDEDDESYFLMGGTVSELIAYLQALDGDLPVSCYLGEGPYLTMETTCSFAVLQPGDGTEEVEITTPTFAIICES